MTKNEQLAFNELDKYFDGLHCHNGAWQTLKSMVLGQPAHNNARDEIVRGCDTCNECPDDDRICCSPNFQCWTPRPTSPVA